MNPNECSERINLTDAYGAHLAAYNARREVLKRPSDGHYAADLSAAKAALEASERAWEALAQHIADHKCLELHWSTDDSADSYILGRAATAALDVILVADDDRRFVDLNEAAADMLGLPRDGIVGRRIDDFFSEARGESVPAAWGSFVADGVQCGICELRASGELRTFEYRAKANFILGLHLSVLREQQAGKPVRSPALIEASSPLSIMAINS